MKEGFEPKSFKNYNLTLAEQLELDNFLKEKDISNHLNCPWHLHFSFYLRKMENSNHVKIIIT